VFTERVAGQPSKLRGVFVREFIKTRWGEARRAGTEPLTVLSGDLIRIKRGEEAGHVTEVLNVIGNVYRSDNRLIVRSTTGELVFYLPWDVEMVERKTTTRWVK